MNGEVRNRHPNIRAELARLGWGYRELAKVLGVGRERVSHCMNGRYEFRESEIRTMSRVFKKDVHYLMGGSYDESYN